MKKTNTNYLIISVLAILVSACGNKNVDLVKKSIESELSDPSSVLYKDVNEFPEGIVCGQVNAKNKFGGYIGFTPFVFRDGQQLNLSTYNFAGTLLCNDKPKKALAFATELLTLANVDLNNAKDAERKAKGNLDFWYAQCDSQKTQMGKLIFCEKASGFRAPHDLAMENLALAEKQVRTRESEVAAIK